MMIAAVEECIAQAQATDQLHFCVVATAGTTTTGNLDRVEGIYRVTQAHQLWLHVDAAYGGALVLSPEYCHLLSGIEKADSITFNPQKWLYVAKTCVMVLFKQFADLKASFQIQAPYMKVQDELTNLGKISVQGTRHADVFKLWLSLLHLGKRNYAQLINESYKLTEIFLEEIRKRPFLEMAGEPQMNILCFRGVPKNISSDRWDDRNAKLHGYLLQAHNTFFSLPLYQGHRWLRTVLLNPYLEQDKI